jgi:TPR repeat protein
MSVENLCNQYLNAYKTIQNYKTNSAKDNVLAGFCVLTYFTLLAPLAVLTISAKDKAIEWFKKSAAQGNANAKANLKKLGVA